MKTSHRALLLNKLRALTGAGRDALWVQRERGVPLARQAMDLLQLKLRGVGAQTYYTYSLFDRQRAPDLATRLTFRDASVPSREFAHYVLPCLHGLATRKHLLYRLLPAFGLPTPRIEATYMSPATYFIAFQNNEIDMVFSENLTPADFVMIENDPVLKDNYLRYYGDFRTDYILFDTFNPPFDNIDVRKAFAHAVDREAIVAGVYGAIRATPAHSMLMPGFPAADTEGDLHDFQRFDCGLARRHLAAAGFADGEGFPALEMWLRGEAPATAAVYQASAASIAQCLNIRIQVSNKDGKVFMDALNARPTRLQLGAVSYGMDFLDPSNLLGIWMSSGRHSWKNEEFDRIVAAASNLIGDPLRRDQLFRDAERILVDDVGGVFIAHRMSGYLFKAQILGASFREPGANGISGRHWGNDWFWGNVYIGKGR